MANEAHFQCPVPFDADRDGLRIPTALLQAGNRLGHARISAFFDTHLDAELAQHVDGRPLEGQVRVPVTQALSEGAPKTTDIPKRLGKSSRTLQRRLADQGIVYQELVDTAPRELSVTLLRSKEVGVAEIAFLDGYAEQSTFACAFKRWYGQSPSRFREAGKT